MSAMLESSAAGELYRELSASWEALGEGGPTLGALALLCAHAIVVPPPVIAEEAQSSEAKAILYVARQRGVIEVRGVSRAFEAPARMLAVYVEEDAQRTICFRDPERPEMTMRFLAAFGELCRGGYVVHHLHHDFSLSLRGFATARQISADEVAAVLAMATAFGVQD